MRFFDVILKSCWLDIRVAGDLRWVDSILSPREIEWCVVISDIRFPGVRGSTGVTFHNMFMILADL